MLFWAILLWVIMLYLYIYDIPSYTCPVRESIILPTYDDITVISKSPKIIVYPEFLTTFEIETLIKTAEPLLKRSTVVGTDISNSVESPDRTSETCFLNDDLPIVNKIKARINKYSKMPIENIESLQVLRYTPGQQYKPHYDYFITDDQTAPQRVETFLIYLNDVEAGGETEFPELGIKIKPQTGLALFWENGRQVGDLVIPDPKTLHAGTPVKSGIKWAMNVWIRNKPIKSSL